MALCLITVKHKDNFTLYYGAVNIALIAGMKHELERLSKYADVN